MSITSKNTYKLSREEFEEILIHFTTSITGLMNEDEVYWSLAKDCIAKLNLEDCVIYTVDHLKDSLVQKAAYGPKNPKDFEIYHPVRIPLGKGISGTVAVSGKAEIISDTTKDPRYIVDDARRFSELAVPIKNEGEIFGVIDCEHSERDFFNQEHLNILTTIATIAGIKIKQLRSQKEAQEKQEKFLEARSQLVDLKLKAFQAHMNPHFVFNSLNAIQFFITSNKKEEALHYISTFSKLIRYYLNHFEEDNLSLKEELEMLESYLKLQKLRYGNQLSYVLNIEGTLPPSEVLIPAFLLQTLLENIIEHSVYKQYQNFNISMNFYSSEEGVRLEVNFTYTKPIEEQKRLLPQYREQIILWQDQIRLLNTHKKYQIEKKVHFNKNLDTPGGTIILKLPNLH